jgi:hypothetical protein
MYNPIVARYEKDIPVGAGQNLCNLSCYIFVDDPNIVYNGSDYRNNKMYIRFDDLLGDGTKSRIKLKSGDQTLSLLFSEVL